MNLDKKIKIDYYSEKDKNEYTNFLLKYPNSNIYHTVEWKEVIERHYHLKPYYLIARDRNKKIRAVLPSFFIKNMYGKRIDSVPYSIYGGAIGEKEYAISLVKKIFKINKELKCNYLIFRQYPPEYGDIYNDFDIRKIEERWNQSLELKDLTRLWYDIDKSNRNSIRKARKCNVVIERMTAVKDIQHFYHLELIIRKKFGVITPSIEFFKILWDVTDPK